MRPKAKYFIPFVLLVCSAMSLSVQSDENISESTKYILSSKEFKERKKDLLSKLVRKYNEKSSSPESIGPVKIDDKVDSTYVEYLKENKIKTLPKMTLSSSGEKAYAYFGVDRFQVDIDFLDDKQFKLNKKTYRLKGNDLLSILKNLNNDFNAKKEMSLFYKFWDLLTVQKARAMEVGSEDVIATVLALSSLKYVDRDENEKVDNLVVFLKAAKKYKALCEKNKGLPVKHQIADTQTLEAVGDFLTGWNWGPKMPINRISKLNCLNLINYTTDDFGVGIKESKMEDNDPYLYDGRTSCDEYPCRELKKLTGKNSELDVNESALCGDLYDLEKCMEKYPSRYVQPTVKKSVSDK